jgi:hypothetical protein
VVILGSNDATPFQSETVYLGEMAFGDASKLIGTFDRVSGQYVLSAHNVGKNTSGVDTTYRYIKCGVVVSGTVATGIDYDAYMVKRT